MEVLVEHTQSGITVMWSKADLQKVREEADKKNGNPNGVPILRQTVDSFEAALMRSLVDQSGPILRELKTATVETDAKETRNGAPLRRLVLKLNRTLSESEKKSVTTISTTLNLWVNDAGIPAC
jgi:hypothetical protein